MFDDVYVALPASVIPETTYEPAAVVVIVEVLPPPIAPLGVVVLCPVKTYPPRNENNGYKPAAVEKFDVMVTVCADVFLAYQKPKEQNKVPSSFCAPET
jgi:hypothetical protein